MHISLYKQLFFSVHRCGGGFVCLFWGFLGYPFCLLSFFWFSFFVKTSKMQCWFNVWTLFMYLRRDFNFILSLVSHLHNCSGVPSKATECLLTNTDIEMDLGPQHTSFFNICLCEQEASRLVFLSKDAEGFQFWIWRVETAMSFKWWFIAIFSVHKILHRPVRVQCSLLL